MKIQVLCENTCHQDGLQCEHGLSLYIETKQHKILFDMGQSDLFIHNAQVLGIDLSQVDIAILSHGHYDHGGGLEAFLQINSIANVYVNEHAFKPYYHGSNKYIGLDPMLKNHPRIIYTQDEYVIDETCQLYTCNQKERCYKTNAYGLYEKQVDEFVEDAFLHEQYLCIHEEGQTIVISGCSHKGILNIIDWFQPDVCVGGFHFKAISTTSDEVEVIKEASKILLNQHTMYYTLHCTGIKQYEVMKQIMGSQLEYISTGDSLII